MVSISEIFLFDKWDNSLFSNINWDVKKNWMWEFSGRACVTGSGP